MDRKSILILVGCFILFFVWQETMLKFYPTPPPAAADTNLVSAAAISTNSTNLAQSPVASTIPLNVSPAGADYIVNTGIPEQLLVLSNDDARYTFTSRGGGLKEVELLHYPETVSSRRHAKHVTNDLATLNAAPVPPVFAILGDQSLQGDGVYTLTAIPGGARAEKTLPNGLTIVKDFQIQTNYLVATSVRFENHSKSTLALPARQWAAGVSTPMGPQDNGYAETVIWYNGAKAATVGSPYFNTNTSSFFGLISRTPKSEYLEGSNNVVWVSAQNQYFTLATMPLEPASAVTVHLMNLLPPNAEELSDIPDATRLPKALTTALIYPGQQLAAGQVLTNGFILYAGPKKYQILATLASRFNNDIDLLMNFGWMSPVSKALLVTMNWLHSSLLLPYGALIIMITIVLKLLFWPLTQASLRSSKRMQALQPQLKALQAKYKDDPQKFTAKQWEFYKKNKINPMSGCLPALLQIPVFIGFYYMLRSAIELRGAQFLWMGDLSKPDTVYSLPLPLHFLGYPDIFIPINPMPLIMVVTLLWQAATTPPAPGMDPSQQKIMKYMPMFMLFFMYTQPSGLALYWTVSNLLTVVQTKLTRAQSADVATGPAIPVSATVTPQKKKK
jgi:YidC/Oxa1 family membrane protein insertase